MFAQYESDTTPACCNSTRSHGAYSATCTTEPARNTASAPPPLPPIRRKRTTRHTRKHRRNAFATNAEITPK